MIYFTLYVCDISTIQLSAAQNMHNRDYKFHISINIDFNNLNIVRLSLKLLKRSYSSRTIGKELAFQLLKVGNF